MKVLLVSLKVKSKRSFINVNRMLVEVHLFLNVTNCFGTFTGL